ncbi:MAG: vanadium-dependent haloperoxidase, partial [Actinomycetota bacterium]
MRRFAGALVAVGLLTASCSLIGDDTACAPEEHSVARAWNEQALDAIRRDFPAPTVHARNLYHLSALQHDLWVAFEGTGSPALLVDQPSPSPPSNGSTDRDSTDGEATDGLVEAMAHGAHHLLTHRYRNAIGGDESLAAFDDLLACSGPGDTEAASYGVERATALIDLTIDDGSRETSGYVDLSYAPANPPLVVDEPGAGLVEPDRWQPLSLAAQTTQNDIELPGGVQEFIGPQWGFVTPFALEPDPERGLPVDPGPPPAAGTDEYVEAAIEVVEYGAWLDPTAGRRLRIDPGAMGDRPIDRYDGPGHPVNPANGRPYAPNEVDEADYGRVIAEYWADGPDSETPPGHWNTLANEASDRIADDGPLRILGEVEVDRLEWDVKLHLALNGALHDAAIAAWGTKAHYDYVRPISMIRHLGETGALPEVDGLIDGAEPVPRILGWRGQPDDPSETTAGVGRILATEWVPYQRATFVTPAFAAYVSGHSAFSRAGAEILTAFTGDAYFPGGLAEHTVEPGGLIHEAGPTEAITLQWATYRDAADEAGRSRLYGGIHIAADDLAGRLVGLEVGQTAWARATELFGLPVG